MSSASVQLEGSSRKFGSYLPIIKCSFCGHGNDVMIVIVFERRMKLQDGEKKREKMENPPQHTTNRRQKVNGRTNWQQFKVRKAIEANECIILRLDKSWYHNWMTLLILWQHNDVV